MGFGLNIPGTEQLAGYVTEAMEPMMAELATLNTALADLVRMEKERHELLMALLKGLSDQHAVQAIDRDSHIRVVR